MPGQKNARWRTPASRYHVADRYTAATRLVDDLRQVSALSGPRHQPRLLQLIDSKFPGTGRFALIGIGTNDLEVRRRTESDKRIACAFAWMLPAWRRLDSEHCLNVPDASSQIRCGVNEMIDPA
jgi:hypothetical protein